MDSHRDPDDNQHDFTMRLLNCPVHGFPHPRIPALLACSCSVRIHRWYKVVGYIPEDRRFLCRGEKDGWDSTELDFRKVRRAARPIIAVAVMPTAAMKAAIEVADFDSKNKK
jgi:hypothetical protein